MATGQIRNIRRRVRLTTTKIERNLMHPARNQNKMIDIANFNNLRANKNSNPSRGPVDNLSSIEARRMADLPAREQNAKLGQDLKRQSVGFLEGKEMHFTCQFPKKSEATCPPRRIPKEKTPAVPGPNLKAAAEGAKRKGQTGEVRSKLPLVQALPVRTWGRWMQGQCLGRSCGIPSN